MDEAAVEAAGASPLEPLLALAELFAAERSPVTLAELHVSGVPCFFVLSDGPDAKSSGDSIAQLRQGGLGLPDRDYYTEEKHADTLRQYEAHVAAVLQLLGDSPEAAAAAAASTVALETRLARAHLTRTERRDPLRTYNPVSGPAELPSAFDYAAYFSALGKAQPGKINVDCVAALAAAAEAAAAPAHELRAYLRWHVANSGAEYLASAFVDLDFLFYQKALSGQKELKPRYKRAVAKTTAHLPEALGQLYVAAAFPGDAKARALAVVASVRDAMQRRLASLPWLQEETRAKALAKLATFHVKIGYPDVWVCYDQLALPAGGPWFAMVLACRRFEHARMLARIGAPVDRSRWMMAPQTVNAYFNPPLNEIVFPAAIMQPPFFDREADDAVNFGAMGAVVGHEISHGFDDQGRKYDANGNVECWWSEADAAEFVRRADVMAAQASAFTVHTRSDCAAPAGPFRLGGSRTSALCDCGRVNGQLTNGENVADLGGLRLALSAFRESSAQASAGDEIDGFTPLQRFFLAWAQVWRATITAEAAALRLTTDPHAPHTFRVNGPLANMEAFHEAFGVKEGDGMWRAPEERVDIW